MQEIEATIASLVERGVMAESEIVAALQAVLPEQFQQLIPSELRNVAPQSPAIVQQQAQESVYEEPPLSAEQLSISQSGTYFLLMPPTDIHCVDTLVIDVAISLLDTQCQLRCALCAQAI